MCARTPPTLRGGGAATRRLRLRGCIRLLALGSLCALLPLPARADQPHTGLRLYGPGGPREVLSECAFLYQALHGEQVTVYRHGPSTMGQRVAEDGDIYFGGAEFMLEDFARANPGVLDLETVERLRPRRLGIIVRKGNPLGIRGPADLQRPGLNVLKASLERVSEFHGETLAADGSVHPVVHRGEDGVRAWRTNPDIDAWITYRSWHVVLAAEADFVEISGDRALRFTPIAITAATPHRGQAERFIAFLRSPEARRIFATHGWD